jgi:hypothetical protein
MSMRIKWRQLPIWEIEQVGNVILIKRITQSLTPHEKAVQLREKKIAAAIATLGDRYLLARKVGRVVTGERNEHMHESVRNIINGRSL